jgi:hypothetical protein
LAVEPRGQVAAKAIKYTVDRFCNGSVGQALVDMVNEATLDRQQLRALTESIEKAKRRRL